MKRYTLGFAVPLLLIASCANTVDPTAAPDETRDEPVVLNIAHLANLTHAPAIFGLEEGIFEDTLGEDVDLNAKTFAAGTKIIPALLAGDIDIGYIGPSPAINGFVQSKGEAVRIIAGATSGGAALVTNGQITSPDDLRGRTIATPSRGNTQDVALRAWLREKELTMTNDVRGAVSIKPQTNGRTLESFRAGDIDGAWVPEPWASHLVTEEGGEVLLDEEDLWEEGQYPTTLIIARTAFLEDHPGIVEDFLKGHVEAMDQIRADPNAAKAAVADRLSTIDGAEFDAEVLDAAWERLTFTYDPLIGSVRVSAERAKAVGLLEDDDVEGIDDLQILNDVLDAAGKEVVET